MADKNALETLRANVGKLYRGGKSALNTITDFGFYKDPNNVPDYKADFRQRMGQSPVATPAPPTGEYISTLQDAVQSEQPGIAEQLKTFAAKQFQPNVDSAGQQQQEGMLRPLVDNPIGRMMGQIDPNVMNTGGEIGPRKTTMSKFLDFAKSPEGIQLLTDAGRMAYAGTQDDPIVAGRIAEDTMQDMSGRATLKQEAALREQEADDLLDTTMATEDRGVARKIEQEARAEENRKIQTDEALERVLATEGRDLQTVKDAEAREKESVIDAEIRMEKTRKDNAVADAKDKITLYKQKLEAQNTTPEAKAKIKQMLTQSELNLELARKSRGYEPPTGYESVDTESDKIIHKSLKEGGLRGRALISESPKGKSYSREGYFKYINEKANVDKIIRRSEIDSQDMIDSAMELVNSKAFTDVVGQDQVYLPNEIMNTLLGGSAEANRFQSVYDKLIADGTLKTIENLRSAITGATGLGNISEKEFDTLKHSFAALAKSQTPETFHRELKKVANTAAKIHNQLLEASKKSFGINEYSNLGNVKNLKVDQDKERERYSVTVKGKTYPGITVTNE